VTSDEAEIFAEAERGNTLLERSAVAMEQVLEKSFEKERASYAVFDFRELFRGELLPARTHWSIVPKTTEEELDFGEGEAHLAGETNEQDAVESVGRVATLAAGAVRRRQQTESFVVADGGGIHAGAVSEFANLHGDSFVSDR
jgi:hypothetical protein